MIQTTPVSDMKIAGAIVLARRGGIDPGSQCGYDTQGVAGPPQALSMGEGRGGG
jgi:hypothetical protein